MFRKLSASRPMALLAALWANRRGVAALEFAFVAPVLLALYFVTMEVAQGIEVNKKTSRVASMVADLVTQTQAVNKADIDAIMRIGEAVIQPYNRTKPEIYVTAINISNDATPQVRVVWSRKLIGGNASNYLLPNSVTTIPERLIVPGSFLIRAEAKLDYRPMITWSATSKESMGLAAAFDRINMGEKYHLRPRMSLRIDCSDC